MQNNKPIPYNTGKVVIGKAYEPPKLSHGSQEDDFWQDVLLGIHEAKRIQRVQFICYVVALTCLMFVIWSW